MRFASQTVLAFAILAVGSGCKQERDTPANVGASAAAKPSDAPAERATEGQGATAGDPAFAPEPGQAGHPTGVEECDDLIKKYSACVSAKAPESSRQGTLEGFQANVDAWVRAAADEAKRAELAAGCKQTSLELQKSSEGWGCQW